MTDPRKLGWPNRITITRILLIGPFVVCLLNLHEPGWGWLRWLAVVIFALMSISDWLDGFLARRLHDESQLGKFLDPLADKLLVTAAVIILCVRGIHDAGSDRLVGLPNWVAVVAIAKDLIVFIGFVTIRMLTGRTFISPRPLGKWTTTFQLCMVLCVLLWLDLPPWLSRLPEALWWTASAMAVLSALDYIRFGARHLAAASPAGETSKETSHDGPR